MSQITKEANSILPGDATQWGNIMHAEAVQRLPKLAAFIDSFRLVYTDSDGKGMGFPPFPLGGVFSKSVSQFGKHLFERTKNMII